jgi:hypothetical protein
MSGVAARAVDRAVGWQSRLPYFVRRTSLVQLTEEDEHAAQSEEGTLNYHLIRID